MFLLSIVIVIAALAVIIEGIVQLTAGGARGNEMTDGGPYYNPKELSYSPRGDRVVVKQLPKPEAKPGEMFIPDSQTRPPDEGIVIAVGPSEKCADIKVGDHVYFLEQAGSPVIIKGERFLGMRESEIHGIDK
jgi:chaperonin GroES